MKYPKALFLDWNGTLSHDKFWGHLETDKNTNELFNSIEKCLFSDLKNLIKPWMKGKMYSEDVCKLISQKTGISNRLLHEELKKSCLGMEMSDSRIIDLIADIKNNIPIIAIATDNMDTFSKWTFPAKLERLNLFDANLNSFEIGYLKNEVNRNQSLFFSDFVKNQNISLSDCVLLDDSDDKLLSKIGLEYRQVKSSDQLVHELGRFK